jgi:hypothetical protein
MANGKTQLLKDDNKEMSIFQAELPRWQSIMAVRSTPSPAPEQFEQLGRSKRLRSARPSSARGVRKESHRPSRILFGRSSPARAAVVFALQPHLPRLPRDVCCPKTDALAGPGFATAYSDWATSSRLQGSAPKQPAHGPSAPGAAPRAAGLRRPPADKLVTSEKGAALAGACPSPG